MAQSGQKFWPQGVKGTLGKKTVLFILTFGSILSEFIWLRVITILRPNFQISFTLLHLIGITLSILWTCNAKAKATRLIHWDFSVPSPNVNHSEATGMWDWSPVRKSKGILSFHVCVHVSACMCVESQTCMWYTHGYKCGRICVHVRTGDSCVCCVSAVGTGLREIWEPTQ